MRVIAGTARGIRLEAPKGLDVRPTLDRVRESLFNILGARVPGGRFLDLFAGTGANGIEALSRGAAHAVFVENDPRALRVLRANLEHARLADHAQVHKGLLPAALDRLRGQAPFDIIFADPPYNACDFKELFDAIERNRLLAAQGLLVVEHAARHPLPERLGSFQHSRTTRYGEAALFFFLDASDGIC